MNDCTPPRRRRRPSRAIPLNERIPDNTTPGVIFVICVIGSMIAFLVWVWYKNLRPGRAARDDGDLDAAPAKAAR